jgi:hypothetical protein
VCESGVLDSASSGRPLLLYANWGEMPQATYHPNAFAAFIELIPDRSKVDELVFDGRV